MKCDSGIDGRKRERLCDVEEERVKKEKRKGKRKDEKRGREGEIRRIGGESERK